MRIAPTPLTLAVLVLAVAWPARAQAPPWLTPLQLTYQTYAIGLHIAEAQASINLGPWTYQAKLAFHTIGVAAVVAAGTHESAVHGTWHDQGPRPQQYSAHGIWRGERRVALIDYHLGIPTITQLLPPLEPERETVPTPIQLDSIDTLSAVSALLRTFVRTGGCELTAHTYDGRRAAEIVAHTGITEILEPTSRSVFSGKALRCDFISRVVAGLLPNDGDRTSYRPLRGSMWVATVDGGRHPIPVRVTIETRWFGDATSYLTGVSY